MSPNVTETEMINAKSYALGLVPQFPLEAFASFSSQDWLDLANWSTRNGERDGYITMLLEEKANDHKPPPPSQQYLPPPSFPEGLLAFWNAPFRGTADYVLLAEIRSLSKADNAYHSKHLPIIQSSGTGKSKLVNQVANSLYTLPLCFRADGDAGFPPTDRDIRNYLTLSISTFEYAHKRHFCFLLSLLQCFTLRMAGSDPEFSSPQSLRQAFDKGMSTQGHGVFRTEFYAEVVTQAQELEKLGIMLPNIDKTLRTKEMTTLSYKGRAYNLHEAASDAVKAIEMKQSVTAKENNILLIAVDEANWLAQISIANPYGPNPHTSLTCLHRLFGQMVRLPVVFPLLSTAITITDNIPEVAKEPSDRAKSTFRISPYIKTGWDQMIDQRPSYSYQANTCWDGIRKFGRPLFATWGPPTSSFNEQEALLQFAAKKLLGGRSVQEWAQRMRFQDILNDPSAAAIVFSQVPINAVVFAAAATPYPSWETHVKHHMAVLQHYASNVQAISVIHPAEPITALASVYALFYLQLVLKDTVQTVKFGRHEVRVGREEVAIGHIYSRILEYVGPTLGDRGEIMAMILCLQAYQASHGASSLDKATFSAVDIAKFVVKLLTPVPTTQFLANLISKAPNNLPLHHHKEGAVRVWQFVNTPYALEDITPALLSAHARRGCGIKCQPRQSGTDLIIPVSFGDFHPSNMGAIYLQIKNRHQLDIKAATRILQSNERLTARSNQPPSMHLVFNFSGGTEEPQFREIPPMDPSNYLAVVSGRTSAVFPMLKQEHLVSLASHMLTRVTSTVDEDLQEFDIQPGM